MRIKRFDISITIFKALLGGKRFNIQATTNPLPQDAELVRIATDPFVATPDKISFFYVSSEFPEVKEGSPITAERILFTEFHGGYNEKHSD